ncbi:putative ATP-dependent RNA helicase [Triangularia verruculosa]|uniref:ATP-dependent DNA helicase n=1 Tax=Triangularia verruculosa TaxID=2587418 RepID=A0AAN7ASJ0_9PEZI|nr:putative ATP-dependent RNA helicase [Triangularia verruculosa]
MDDEFDETFDFDDDLIALTQVAEAEAAAAAAAQRPPPPRPPPRTPATANNGLQRLQRSFPRAPAASSVSSVSRANAAAAASEFDDLPSDAFDSSPEPTNQSRPSHVPPPRATPRSQGQGQNFRQTTLWGSTVQQASVRPQATNSRLFRADLPPEVPTHHQLNEDELTTWVYPLNLGPIRDYQFSIVNSALFNNTLVALPTGLGKTFIAATVMLNFYRWTKRGKIIFVAPTKPLASQQVKACLDVAGIPRSEATLLTGETAPALREAEWKTKRLFFMTPQTLQNDLSKGYADPKSVVLLVVDEAHRATGDYAYVKVIEFLRRFSQSFRVLALTATPGSSVEGVQDVIDNLGISHVEIRTEESLDIRQYVHSRETRIITLEPSDEMMEVRGLFTKAIQPLVDKLSAQNIYFGRDPMSLTTYGLMKSRNDWLAGAGRHANQGLKFAMFAVFSILQSLAHSIKLLNFHGIKPFYHNLLEFRTSEEEKGGKGSNMRRQVIDDENFKKMMTMIEKWIKLEGFSGHPKLDYLCETLVNHFMDAGEASNTRVIVFSEYRDSAEEIVRVLNSKPLISARVFVGQADSKRSEGMKQKEQIEAIEKFKNGQYNVLVATSIGEEGLDIGQVDLIVCYDASSSPIRMLQRMGRTGRKRAGRIVLLLMKGKEHDKFLEAKDNYAKMQQLICDGDSFNFRHDLSTRIVPRDIKPEVDKRMVEIPIENTQDPSLPEPKKGGARKKASKKKFNMPDGVETGFVKASDFFGKASTKKAPIKFGEYQEINDIAEVPPLEKAILTGAQALEHERRFLSLPQNAADAEIQAIDFGAHQQRTLQSTSLVKHGEKTKKFVKLMKKMGDSQDPFEKYTKPYGETDTSNWQGIPAPVFAPDTDGSDFEHPAGTTAGGHNKKRKAATRISDDGLEEEEEEEAVSPPARNKRNQGKKAPKRKRGKVARNLEEIGDDCTRTSDVEMSDGLDDGADLEDFVVVDDDEDVIGSSGNRRTPGSAAKNKRKEALPAVERPFFEPMVFDSSQDTDEEMPDISELGASSVKKTKHSMPVTAFGAESKEDLSPEPTPRKKKRRHFVADSDDEDDE